MTPNWNALGVSNQELTRPPQPDMMPSSCNPNTRLLWRQAVGTVSESDVTKAWARVFDTYMSLCKKKGMYPFTDNASNNDRIYSELIKARRSVVDFINKYRVQDQFSVRTTKRVVRLTSTGFVLRCEGHCDRVTEPLPLIDKMGLRKNSSEFALYWTRNLERNVVFWVANQGAKMSGRWIYGYTATIDLFPSIPGKVAAPTQEIENFILKILYLPILRAYRPIGLQHRLV